ncbi:uncharacterized protein SCHCODRAFT_02749139 [Schizophyllum commune H4-8]|nr:uncharacterized protein SCHCODRAFT_02749139 [Schizophyllum commune H4-8]KAI5891009.1 hypothetical protein SCHCODRAFT_02749139 [Schizophyllum commune H4-8]
MPLTSPTIGRIKQLACLLRDPPDSPGNPPRSETRSRLKQALRAMPLESLDTNPFAADTSASRGRSPITLPPAPVRVLAELGELTWIPKDEEPLLRDTIVHCIRPRSGFIIDWMELLVPQNGHLANVPVDLYFLCTDVLALLHGLELDLALDITQAARLHILVFKMWLDPPSPEVFRSLETHELYHDRVAASLVFMMDKVMVRLDQPPSPKSRARDGIVEALLVFCGHRPRRLYRRIVRSITKILMTPIDPTQCAERYIYFLRLCVGNYIVIQNHSRNVVRGLVEIIRIIGRRFGGRGHGAACEACGVLYQIWFAEKDNGSRALCWALRAGVLPLILSLRRQGTDESLSNALNFIAERSISVPVARALRVGGYGMSFREAGVAEPLATIYTECMVDRPSLQQDQMGRKCSYEQCPAGRSAFHARVYRCTCFQNYCSAACQQADWPEHKKVKHGPKLPPSDPQEMVLEGELTSSDAHFTMLCADVYVCTHIAQVVDEALALPLRENTSLQPLYIIKLDYTTVPMQCCVCVDDGEEDDTEPMVIVRARVNSSVGRWHMATVDAHMAPLSALYSMARALI